MGTGGGKLKCNYTSLACSYIITKFNEKLMLVVEIVNFDILGRATNVEPTYICCNILLNVQKQIRREFKPQNFQLS